MASKKVTSQEASEMQQVQEQIASLQGSLNAVLALLQEKGPSIVKASDRDWQDMTRTEHVVTTGDTLQAETEASRLKDDLQQLAASAKSQKTLTGTIIGVKSANADNDTATQLAEVQFGNDTCTVLIPSYELWDYDVEKYRTKDTEKDIERNMIDMIGAEVPFVVQRVDKSSRTAIASRLQALEKEIRANYRRTTRTGKPRVMVGSLVEAKIIAYKKNSLLVNVLGIDTKIPATREDNRLTWDYVQDIYSWAMENGLYKNTIIQVRVQGIELYKAKKLNREYDLGGIKVSYKDTCQNPMEIYWNTIHEGEKGSCIITGISDAGVFVKYKNRVPVLCKAPEIGKEPKIGDTNFVVEITLKEDKPETGKRIFGIFKVKG